MNLLMATALTQHVSKYICAPMVDQSGVAFRELTRRYGVGLAYTPMLHAEMTVSSNEFLESQFSTRPGDTPLIAQIAGNKPDVVERAARRILTVAREQGNEPVGFDLNLGCPQHIARKGNYGSYLLERDLDGAVKVVERLAQGFDVSVKIRLLMDDDIDASRTIAACRRLIDAGATMLCVHGRTLKQNKQLAGAADWNKMGLIKDALPGCPVIANGGISCRRDADLLLHDFGFDGVMSSEALLDNPALFLGNGDDQRKLPSRRDLCREYLDLAAETKTHVNHARGHLFKMLHGSLTEFTDVRDALARRVNSISDMYRLVDYLDDVVDPDRSYDLYGSSTEDSFLFHPRRAWYWRHRYTAKQLLLSDNDNDVLEQQRLEDRIERKKQRKVRKDAARARALHRRQVVIVTERPAHAEQAI